MPRGQRIGQCLAQLESELHLHRDLDAGAADLAVSLPGVTVAGKEERAGYAHREPDDRSRPEAAPVHVAAVWSGGRGGDGLATRGSDAKAADHRLQREGQSRERGRGIDQAHRSRRDVDRPFGGLPIRQVGRPVRVDDIRRQRVAGPPDLPRGGETDDRYFERVAGHRALHPDGTALGIGPLAALRSGAIDAEGVERLHDDGIAWLHAERGRVLAHGVEEALGIETVRGHAVPSRNGETVQAGIVAFGDVAGDVHNVLCNYRDIVIYCVWLEVEIIRGGLS